MSTNSGAAVHPQRRVALGIRSGARSSGVVASKTNVQLGSQPANGGWTLADVIGLYLNADDYKGLASKTKESYDTALSRIRCKFGTIPLEALEEQGARSVIRRWRDEKLGHHKRSADLTMAVFRKVLNFAKDEEILMRNPLDALRNLSSGTRKDVIWSDEQIERFAAVGPRHLVRAMILAKWTGQRQADLLALTWSAYDGDFIKLQQRKAGRGKSGRRVKIRVATELRDVLEQIRHEQEERHGLMSVDGTPLPSMHILTTERGVPWRSGFKASWRKAVSAAGIKGVTFHDLRGTFITLAHRAGASIREIAEASGHDEKECERVIRQHYLAGGAETVIERLQARAASPAYGITCLNPNSKR